MEDKYEQKIHNTLRELERLREKFGLSQTDIAEKIGVTRPAYTQWLNPERDIRPNLESWFKIQEFLEN